MPLALRAPALSSGLTTAALIACVGAASAQTAPDAGSLLRESQQQAPKLPQLPQVESPKMLQDTGIKVVVQRFEVSGSSRFDAARFTALFADLIGKELGFAQLQAAADRVATLYRTQGLHATAYLPEQTLENGTVRIVVVEGRFGKIRVEQGEGTTRALPIALVERMLARGQTRGEMLDAAQLERATLIANEVPGVRVAAVLVAGENPGETDVIAKVDARPVLAGLATVDNQDSRATGAWKAGAALSLNGLAGFGDVAQLVANSSEGKQYLRGAYDVPIGASGLRGSVNASYMHYKLQNEFAASGAKGSATTAGALLTYSVLRSAERNVYASATFDHKHLVNDSIAGNLSDKTDDAVALAVNGDLSDTLGGGGANVASATLTFGRIDLGGNAADLATDQAGLRTDGHYTKVGASIGRLQRLTENGALWLSLNGQFSNRNLDSGEKYSLGGVTGVRAYPSLEASGDAGYVFTVEYRHRVGDRLQWSAFYDFGAIKRQHDPLPVSPQPNRYDLKGIGAAVEWQVGPATVRGTLAQRLGDNPAAAPNGRDSDGTRRRPQYWVSVNLPF